MQKWSSGRIARTLGRRRLQLLAADAQAADKVGVSMPNIKGPWLTPSCSGSATMPRSSATTSSSRMQAATVTSTSKSASSRTWSCSR